MTRFKDTLPPSGAKQKQTAPSRWVKTLISGSDKCQMTLLGQGDTRPPQDGGVAYVKLSLMDSGAVMASFPVMGMASGAFKALYGAQWIDLDTPLILPAPVLGQEISIAAGQHPLVFVLENWVVLFRPEFVS
jgi:hypothetical protein